MGIRINADGLAGEVMKALEEYQDASFNTLKSAVDATAKHTVKELNRTSPKQSGKYAKDWAQKEDRQSRGWAYARIVYNKKHYRLTHLLEYGHAVKPRPKRSGKKDNVGAIPHIAAAEQKAVDELIKNLRDNL